MADNTAAKVKAIIINELKDNMKWYEKLEECELGSREKYSQYGEEGVLNRIFKNITPSHKYAVEMGAMDGDIGSNTKWLEVRSKQFNIKPENFISEIP